MRLHSGSRMKRSVMKRPPVVGEKLLKKEMCYCRAYFNFSSSQKRLVKTEGWKEGAFNGDSRRAHGGV